MSKFKNDKIKFITLLLIAVISLFTVIAFVISRLNDPKEYLIKNLYDMQSYSVFTSYYEDSSDEVYNDTYFFNKNFGTMSEYEGVIVDIKTDVQHFYKDLEDLWNVTLHGNEYLPGSIEDILDLNYEESLKEFKRTSDPDVCSKLEVEKCVAFFDSNGNKLYFDDSSKEIKHILFPEEGGILYSFGNINQDKLNLGGKFDELREQIEKDLEITLEEE